MQIKYTTDSNGYMKNFSVIGELSDGKLVDITDFDEINFDCYKEIDGKLIFDKEKLNMKSNPEIIKHLPTLEEKNRADIDYLLMLQSEVE